MPLLVFFLYYLLHEFFLILINRFQFRRIFFNTDDSLRRILFNTHDSFRRIILFNTNDSFRQFFFNTGDSFRQFFFNTTGSSFARVGVARGGGWSERSWPAGRIHGPGR